MSQQISEHIPENVYFQAIDHELSAAEEATLRSHLAQCPLCAAAYARAQETEALLQAALAPVEPPADLTARIMAAYDQILQAEAATSTAYVQNRQAEGTTFAASEQTRQMEGTTFVTSEQSRQGSETKIAAYDRTIQTDESPLAAGWWLKFKEIWQGWTGSMRFRVAAVSLAALALVLFASNLGKAPAPQVAVNPPNTQIQQTEPALVTPEIDTAEPSPDVETPAADPEAQPVEEPADPAQKPADQPAATQPAVKPAQKPDTKPAEVPATGEIQLPQAASVETRVASVQIQPLVEGLEGNRQAPVLSADEKTVYYLSVVDHQYQAWSLELVEGAQPVKISRDELPAAAAKNSLPEWWPGSLPADGSDDVIYDWSPDGRQLAVNLAAANTDGGETAGPGVWLVQADGTAPLRMSDAGGGNALAWSPDGGKIAFSDQSGKLWVLYLREHILVQMTNGEDSFRNLRDFVWLSDSKTIIFFSRKNSEVGGGVYRITLP